MWTETVLGNPDVYGHPILLLLVKGLVHELPSHFLSWYSDPSSPLTATTFLGVFYGFIFKKVSLALSLAQVIVLSDFQSPIIVYTYSPHFLYIQTLPGYLANLSPLPNWAWSSKEIDNGLTDKLTFSQSSISAPLPYQPPPNSPAPPWLNQIFSLFSSCFFFLSILLAWPEAPFKHTNIFFQDLALAFYCSPLYSEPFSQLHYLPSKDAWQLALFFMALFHLDGP